MDVDPPADTSSAAVLWWDWSRADRQSVKWAITSTIKHAIKLKTSPAILAQLLQPSLAFCFSLQPMTAYRHWLQAKTKCWWGLQQLCKSCRTCFMFYCMFYFTCDRSFTDCKANVSRRELESTKTQYSVNFSDWSVCLWRFARGWIQSVMLTSVRKISVIRLTPPTHCRKNAWTLRLNCWSV